MAKEHESREIYQFLILLLQISPAIWRPCYGRCTAFYDWWDQDASRRQQLEDRLKSVDRARWRQLH